MKVTLSEHLDERVKSVFQRALRIDPSLLSDDTRRGQLEQWDSLGHFSVIRELEDEFGVAISPEQALQMDTIADIKSILGTTGESPSVVGNA